MTVFEKDSPCAVPRRLTAADELALLRDYPALIPRLCAGGLPVEQAQAVAYNTAMLCHSLKHTGRFLCAEDIWEVFSLAEIAQYCEKLVDSGEYKESGADVL